jgi:hypothetical protein
MGEVGIASSFTRRLIAILLAILLAFVFLKYTDIY